MMTRPPVLELIDPPGLDLVGPPGLDLIGPPGLALEEPPALEMAHISVMELFGPPDLELASPPDLEVDYFAPDNYCNVLCYASNFKINIHERLQDEPPLLEVMRPELHCPRSDSKMADLQFGIETNRNIQYIPELKSIYSHTIQDTDASEPPGLECEVDEPPGLDLDGPPGLEGPLSPFPPEIAMEGQIQHLPHLINQQLLEEPPSLGTESRKFVVNTGELSGLFIPYRSPFLLNNRDASPPRLEIDAAICALPKLEMSAPPPLELDEPPCLMLNLPCEILEDDGPPGLEAYSPSTSVSGCPCMYAHCPLSPPMPALVMDEPPGLVLDLNDPPGLEMAEPPGLEMIREFG